MPSTKIPKNEQTSPTNKENQKKANTDLPEHVLIRFKSEDGLTISEHRNMIIAKGSAIFGKIGQGLSLDYIALLNKQIARGAPTYLFLTTREGWNGPYVTYECRLKNVQAQLDSTKYDFVPKYYSAEYKNVKTWFEILTFEKMSKLAMNRIFVLSSGRVIMSVISSSATVFRVGLKDLDSVQN